MQRVFGLETEYGITVDGHEDLDVVHESIQMVRSYTEHGAFMKWNYEMEDPHKDARGFRVDELLQDTDEAAYFELDKNRELTWQEIKSDLVLSNGARYYNDHAHPEYSTPECTTLKEIVAQDSAGERVISECARRRNQHLPPNQHARLYKNNTDFVGHSYGCHDNFLMQRDVPWERIVRDVIPFLVTRQIFAGAGKMGVEAEGEGGTSGIFQLAQRSDFFSVLCSIDTMNRRPIVNTRDEPHADAAAYRRFHVIVGDANMSQWATAMKMGTTALVLSVIEADRAPLFRVASPVDAVKHVSRDEGRRWMVPLEGGAEVAAVDLQRAYLQAAREVCDLADPDVAWVLREWETVLNDLESDYTLCADRVDWVAKFQLLQAFREEQGLDWSDPWLQSIDLEYHNASLDEGLYYELLRQGSMRRIVSEDEIRRAIFHPPETTRAFFRGRSVARFHPRILSLAWDEIAFHDSGNPFRVHFPHPGHHAETARINLAMHEATDCDDLLARLKKGDAVHRQP